MILASRYKSHELPTKEMIGYLCKLVAIMFLGSAGTKRNGTAQVLILSGGGVLRLMVAMDAMLAVTGRQDLAAG